MALTSVFVSFYNGFDVSISTLADRISRLAGRSVSRVDDVRGSTGRYCFVHFDREMPEILWDMLSAGQEIIQTAQGPIRIGLSNGMDLKTKEEITQYTLSSAGLYSRNIKTGIVCKWNEDLHTWVDTV